MLTPLARTMIYLDWNATTPPCTEALDAMRSAALDGWANPASVHGPGRAARRYVEEARRAVGALAGFEARDVVLTSGGTEANNLALRAPFAEARGVLVTSRLEHPSVARTAESLEREGVEVVWLPVPRSGRLDPDDVARVLAAREGGVRLVSVQAVNHETGVVQPIEAVASVCAQHGVLLHCDVVQAVGRLAPSSWAGADLVSIAGHKLRGPKGIGALATRCGIRLRALQHGGAQERGLRPGTQDPIACAGLAAAARRAEAGPARYDAVREERDRLEQALLAIDLDPSGALRPTRNGEAERAPHVANLSFPGWRGPELAAALDLEGVAVSSGSACSAGTSDPSPILDVMFGPQRARDSLRISLGETTSSADVDAAIAAFRRVLARGRARSSSAS
jgi:cysteine desulfurase